jgi:hypothetical protein
MAIPYPKLFDEGVQQVVDNDQDEEQVDNTDHDEANVDDVPFRGLNRLVGKETQNERNGTNIRTPDIDTVHQPKLVGAVLHRESAIDIDHDKYQRTLEVNDFSIP